MNKFKRFPVFRLVLLIALVVRLFQLSADMPLYISPCADEGIYVHNARNQVLFGEWVLDDWNNMYISPIFNYFVYLSFSLFGVGFVQARLVSVAASLVTIWLVFACLKRRTGIKAALMAGLLLSVNYVYVAFGKMALMEPAMIMFMVLAMYFFLRGGGRGPFLFLCGVCCSLAFITKNLAGFYFIVPYAALFLGGRVSGKLRACSLVLAGQLSVISVWFFTWYLPNRGFIDLHNRIKIEERAPVSVAGALINAAAMFRNPFFGMVPLLSAAVLIGLLVVVLAVARRKRIGAVELYALLWLAANFACLSVFSWRPLRYFLSLLVPMVILAVVPLFRESGTDERGGGVLTALYHPRWRKGVMTCTSLLVAASLLWSAYNLGWAWLHPRSMWPSLAREIRKRIPGTAVISGGPAMGAGMGIKNRLVWIHQLADYSRGDPFARYGIDCLVVDGRELEFYKKVFPDVLPRLMKESRLVYRMPLDDRGDALFIKLPAERSD